MTGFGSRTAGGQADLAVVFVYTMFAIGIARSWELLGLRGGGLLDLLADHLASRQPAPLPGGPEPRAPGQAVHPAGGPEPADGDTGRKAAPGGG